MAPIHRFGGFKTIEVDDNCFSSQVLKMGEDIIDAGHLYNIIETVSIDSSVKIVAKCVPAHKIHEKAYLVELQLNANRRIISMSCTCPSGKMNCKHKAALCHFIENETVDSCTSNPQKWGKIKKVVYKGTRLEELYPPKESTPSKPFDLHSLLMEFDFDCDFMKMYKHEMGL